MKYDSKRAWVIAQMLKNNEENNHAHGFSFWNICQDTGRLYFDFDGVKYHYNGDILRANIFDWDANKWKFVEIENIIEGDLVERMRENSHLIKKILFSN